MAIRSLLKLPVVGYASEADFLKNIDAMVALAKQQQGFISVEVWKSHTDTDPLVYLVESEWETRADMAAMENHPEHDEVMSQLPPRPHPPALGALGSPTPRITLVSKQRAPVSQALFVCPHKPLMLTVALVSAIKRAQYQ